jgi:hypothetical protein
MILIKKAAKSQNSYEVTGLNVLNSTKDSLEIGWTLPSSSDYDKFEISYIVVDTRANQTIDVSKDSTSFLVSDLQPGSTLLFYVNTFKGGSSVASVYFSPTNSNLILLKILIDRSLIDLFGNLIYK